MKEETDSFGWGARRLRYLGKVHAPEFPPGLDWINTDRPLTLRDFRGKILALDFWTFG